MTFRYAFMPANAWAWSVNQAATRVAVMRAGKLVEMAAAEQILHERREEYTKELLAAVPAL